MGPSIQSLPAELIELTLIFSAASGNPASISAIAQTCRAFRALVYHSADQHLWREAFLTTFDDPRAGLSSNCIPEACSEVLGATTKKPDEASQNSFDWGAEFRLRIWAERYITSRVSLESETTDDGTPACFNADNTSRNIRALEALSTAVQAALPCPPTIVCAFLTNPVAYPTTGNFGILEPRESASQPSFPIFPPIPLGSGSKRLSSKGSTNNHTDQSQSLNISWFERVLARGLPRTLSLRLAGPRWPLGNIPYWQEDNDDAREVQALGRVVCYTGFIPVPSETPGPPSQARDPTPSSPTPSEDSNTSSGHGSANDAAALSSDPFNVMDEVVASDILAASSFISTYDMSEAAQNRRARRLGRMRVYNMRYLRRSRHWGPYLPAQGIPMTPRQRHHEGEGEDELLEPILALFANVHRSETEDDGDEEEDDNENENEGGDGSDEDTLAGYDVHIVTDEAHEGSDFDEDLTVHPEGSAAPPPRKLPQPPTSAQLRPDWAYLAAARVVVEANLRDALKHEDLAGLVSLEGLRQGSAPREPNDWAVRKPDGDDLINAWKGKGKANAEMSDARAHKSGLDCHGDEETEVEEVEGWDWAGVTGVWRRCVCWMDYRDLILHNLSSEFNDPRMQEAVRIVPMRLRVSYYTTPTNLDYPDRPCIHVVGETAGSGHTNHVRRIRGTVSVLGDGSVRWNLYSSTDEGDTDEWVTEGVQVGGVASAMGVLGMWTGAQHEKMDPLGPFWQWKVC